MERNETPIGDLTPKNNTETRIVYMDRDRLKRLTGTITGEDDFFIFFVKFDGIKLRIGKKTIHSIRGE